MPLQEEEKKKQQEQKKKKKKNVFKLNFHQTVHFPTIKSIILYDGWILPNVHVYLS
jgi:hypothetical protein